MGQILSHIAYGGARGTIAKVQGGTCEAPQMMRRGIADELGQLFLRIGLEQAEQLAELLCDLGITADRGARGRGRGGVPRPGRAG